MGDVVNLRRARKDKRRDEHAVRAAANRVGRTKADLVADRDAAARAASKLDGIKRDV